MQPEPFRMVAHSGRRFFVLPLSGSVSGSASASLPGGKLVDDLEDLLPLALVKLAAKLSAECSVYHPETVGDLVEENSASSCGSFQ